MCCIARWKFSTTPPYVYRARLIVAALEVTLPVRASSPTPSNAEPANIETGLPIVIIVLPAKALIGARPFNRLLYRIPCIPCANRLGVLGSASMNNLVQLTFFSAHLFSLTTSSTLPSVMSNAFTKGLSSSGLSSLICFNVLVSSSVCVCILA